MSTPILYDKGYKAATYSMFLVVVLVLSLLLALLIGVVDHALKSPEPLSALFRKDSAAVVAENIELRRQLDSLKREIAIRPVESKPIAQTGVARNVQVPRLGHYSNDALKNSNFSKYLEEKMKFYYNKSEQLEVFISQNW